MGKTARDSRRCLFLPPFANLAFSATKIPRRYCFVFRMSTKRHVETRRGSFASRASVIVDRSRDFGIRRECGAKVPGPTLNPVEVQKLMDPSHRACRREAIRAEEVQAIDPPPPVDLPSIFAPSLYLPSIRPLSPLSLSLIDSTF